MSGAESMGAFRKACLESLKALSRVGFHLTSLGLLLPEIAFKGWVRLAKQGMCCL